MISLEFLVPVYERIDSAVRAVDSVLSQIPEDRQSVSVSIVVRDDTSPSFTGEAFESAFSERTAKVRIERNPRNLGMSANIRSLIANSSADFVAVLTDDDELETGALLEICDRLAEAKKDRIDLGSLMTPRHCFSEGGAYLFTTDRLFEKEQKVSFGPLSAIRFCTAAHVLTWAILLRSAINLDLWKRHEQNAYFPIIYLGDLLLNHDCLYVPEKWFKHTVYNHCYWHAWGASPGQIQAKLNRDYIEAMEIIDQRALARYGLFMIGAHRAIIGQHFNRLRSLSWCERMMIIGIAKPHFFFHVLAALALTLIRDVRTVIRRA